MITNEAKRKERGVSTRRTNVTVHRWRTSRAFWHLSLFAVVTLLIPLFDVTTKTNYLASAATSSSNTSQRKRKNEKIKRLCLISPQFPWLFGPYQTQMYNLSLLMHERGYEIYYLVKNLPEKFPTGLFRSIAELQLKKYNIMPPPMGFTLSHISAYIGRDLDVGFPGFKPKPGDPKQLVGSSLNAVAQRYELDAVIVLYDLINILPDVRSTVPLIGWFPLHNSNPYVGSREYFSLMHTHAVASLSPSSTSIFQSMLNSREPHQLHSSHSLPIRTIPHIINRENLDRDAAAGSILLTKSSPASSSSLIHQRRLGVDVAVASFGSAGAVRTKAPHPVFSSEERDTFVVLLQGGNYDKVDRKGWDTSLQAFAKFYARRYADEAVPPPYRIHLFVHSMESFLIPMDENYGKAIPPILEPQGINLRHRLKILDLPSSAYTLEYYMHEPEIVAAFKRRANVCLHGSKVEGFGMNVLECQALGTPVITTNYTAMGDYTKHGKAVDYKQTIFPTESIGHDMALPDVEAMVTALDEIYEEFIATRESDDAADRFTKRQLETRAWIDETFSAPQVGDAFDDILSAALVEYDNRETKRRQSLRRGPPPLDERPMFRIVEGDFPPMVTWEEPFTVLLHEGTKLTKPDLLQKDLWGHMVQRDSDTVAFSLKSVYDDGKEVPLMDKENNLHNHYPIIVRSYILTEIQKVHVRRVSLAQIVLNYAMQRQAAQRIESNEFLLYRKIVSTGKDNFYAYYYGNEQEPTTTEDGSGGGGGGGNYFNGLFDSVAPDL